MSKDKESRDERSDVLIAVDELIAKQRAHNAKLVELETRASPYLKHKAARVALKEVFHGNDTQRALEVLDAELRFGDEVAQSVIDRLQ
ncbi:MAG TPA: hypothetical protein VHC22_32590 [Pirellulales bacterium]|nr:hypothetical protein [Pirellulales bacterium]